MEQPILKGKIREASGKKGMLSALRNQGMIPSVVYGKEVDTQSITIEKKELAKLIRNHGENALISLEIEGKHHPVLIREIQRDPVRYDAIHVDFLVVSMTEEIEFTLPVVIVGESIGVKQHGGVLESQLRELRAKALPGDMIESIEVDVSHMDIGDTLTVGELTVDEKIEILDDLDEVIVTVSLPDEEPEEEEEIDEDAEPELIGEDEEEEEEEE